MDKKEAINLMFKQKDELDNMDKIAGRQPAITKIRSRISFCSLYKLSSKELELLVKEGDNDIKDLKRRLGYV